MSQTHIKPKELKKDSFLLLIISLEKRVIFFTKRKGKEGGLKFDEYLVWILPYLELGKKPLSDTVSKEIFSMIFKS